MSTLAILLLPVLAFVIFQTIGYAIDIVQYFVSGAAAVYSVPGILPQFWGLLPAPVTSFFLGLLLICFFCCLLRKVLH